MKNTKLNIAWEKLFSKYNILNEINRNEVFRISAKQIKEYREPRLMTKFDFSNERPNIFKKNNLSILPDSRGTYVIGRFKAYKDLDNYETNPERVTLPPFIDSFKNFTPTSETVALNIAKMTGMIDEVMLRHYNEPSAESTVTGRLNSGRLKYDIDFIGNNRSYSFDVYNSQMEIDEGFENLKYLSIIEAKNSIPKDFMIRQLYYPYRKYLTFNTNKEILPIFFTHADDIYTFHVFRFTDMNNYSSIRKIDQKSFIVDKYLDISMDDLKEILNNSKELIEDQVPFPQANSLTRMLDMVRFLKSPKSKYEISFKYNFSVRQSDYYGNALVYIKLAFKNSETNKFELTDLGKKISKYPNSNKRNLIVIKQILDKKCFKLIMNSYISNSGEFDFNYSKMIISKYSNNIGKDTITRRTQTVKRWLDWILNVAVS